MIISLPDLGLHCLPMTSLLVSRYECFESTVTLCFGKHGHLRKQTGNPFEETGENKSNTVDSRYLEVEGTL